MYIDIGKVPINIHGVGVFFPGLFSNQFDQIEKDHQFQKLGSYQRNTFEAHRKGIYLSNVIEEDNGDRYFNLLRCSTNLSGPTDNFRDFDKMIIKTLNEYASNFYDSPYEFNHVLAQIYENFIDENNKSKKGSISVHSDKSKDMPIDQNPLIGFVTFYDLSNLQNDLKKYHNSDDVFDQLHLYLGQS